MWTWGVTRRTVSRQAPGNMCQPFYAEWPELTHFRGQIQWTNTLIVHLVDSAKTLYEIQWLDQHMSNNNYGNYFIKDSGSWWITYCAPWKSNTSTHDQLTGESLTVNSKMEFPWLSVSFTLAPWVHNKFVISEFWVCTTNSNGFFPKKLWPCSELHIEQCSILNKVKRFM